MPNQFSIMELIHTTSTFVDGTVEVKLIDAWELAGEKAVFAVVAVLSVVDDILEVDGGTSFWEV